MIAIIEAIMPSVAPQVTVMFCSGSTGQPGYQCIVLAAIASRNGLAPHVMAYWLMSAATASMAACLISAGAAKSGKPWARLMAPWRLASRVISRITDSPKVLALAEMRGTGRDWHRPVPGAVRLRRLLRAKRATRADAARLARRLPAPHILQSMIARDVIHQAPKVLLNDHLDGGLRPQTVIELARDVGYDGLPTTDPDELAKVFTAGADRKSLELYLEGFVHTVAVMQAREGLERV